MQHKLHILVYSAHTYRVSTTSSSENTMLRAKLRKLGESNLLMGILFFEELIELS
jgi:hypothetical protein